MTDRRTPGGEVRALQAALSGAHAAMWGYGVLGPRLPEDEQQLAHRAHAAHRELRGRLQDLLVAREETPVTAAAGYRLPFEVDGPGPARRLARHLEEGCAALYADLVAAALTAPIRLLAADELTACTTRHLRWQGETVAFPGLAERA